MVMEIGEVCIGKTGEALLQAGTVCYGIAVQRYVLWGIGIFILGLMMASFVPLPQAKKMGLGLSIVGLVIAIALPYLIDYWTFSQTFRIIVYSAAVFIIIMMILFPKSKEITEGMK